MNIENKVDSNNMPNNQKKTTAYDITKIRYDSFVAKMEKSDMKNGYTRYLMERSMLLTLKEQAKQYATEKEVQEATFQLERVEEILKEQFGIGFSSK